MVDGYAGVETGRFLLEVEAWGGRMDMEDSKRMSEREGGGMDDEGEQGRGREERERVGEVLRELVRGAAEECEGLGVGVRTDLVVAVARKEGGE